MQPDTDAVIIWLYILSKQETLIWPCVQVHSPNQSVIIGCAEVLPTWFCGRCCEVDVLGLPEYFA